jgi:hypothetical protein
MEAHTQKKETPMNKNPTIAAVVSHRVADFEAWKNVFDGDADRRAQAGIVKSHINRSADDANQLSVYLGGTDREALEGFLNDDALKAKMKEAGVQGPPTIRLMEPQEDESVLDSSLAGLIVTHEVKDYAAWKAVFDEAKILRDKVGIVGHAVNRAAAKPNLVVVFLQAPTRDALIQHAEDPALKEAMEKAGVISKPEFNFVDSDAWGEA